MRENPPVTSGFLSQRANNAESIYMPWCRHNMSYISAMVNIELKNDAPYLTLKLASRQGMGCILLSLWEKMDSEFMMGLQCILICQKELTKCNPYQQWQKRKSWHTFLSSRKILKQCQIYEMIGCWVTSYFILSTSKFVYSLMRIKTCTHLNGNLSRSVEWTLHLPVDRKEKHLSKDGFRM